jgi:MinD-like ATPase involved in chromosome partitioning or flagellar assembly
MPSAPALVGRLKARWSPAEPSSNIERAGHAAYLRMLEDAIAASRIGPSRVVAVISSQPGVGATTVAALLATMLGALRGDRVAVVDASPESAALSHWLSPDSGLAPGTYRLLFGSALTPDQVQAAMVRAGSGLWVLPASADQATARAAGVEAWRRLIEQLRHLHNNVIVDCGAVVQRGAGKAAFDGADQVVIVSRADARGIEKVGADVAASDSLRRAVVVVANQAPRPQRARTSAAGVQQVTLVFDRAAALRLKTRGFSWDQAPASWQEGVRELAATLAGSALTREP